MQIDGHQHFWHPGRGDYGWMPPDDPVLSRHYSPADLAPALAEHGIARTVLVQAAPTVEETEYMLGIADATDHVAAVVGWIDFERPASRAVLERLKGHPKFRGVRPMVQDIADDEWLLRPEIDWAFRGARRSRPHLRRPRLSAPSRELPDDPETPSEPPRGRRPLHEAADRRIDCRLPRVG